MEQATLVQNKSEYSVATVGNMADFGGKVFLKELINTTGMEVSIGSIEAGQSVPFYHSHKQNEEVYIFLSGEGRFILDNDEIAVESGTIVRVAPSVMRRLCNSGSAPLQHICIQAKAGSLEGYTMTDCGNYAPV